MNPIAVGIVGYGVIGRRVADAVIAQQDMRLIGIAGRRQSRRMRAAGQRGLDLYPIAPSAENASAENASAKLPRERGTFSELAAQVDVILDCTASGIPQLIHDRSESADHPPVITQGGERHPANGVSFNSFANFSDAAGQQSVRVISCSSTGITRLICALDRRWQVQDCYVALARRASDPAKISKAPLNSLRPTMGCSHHGADVRTVLPGLAIRTQSVDCPTTLGHVLDFQLRLADRPHPDEVLSELDGWPRIVLGQSASTGDWEAAYRQRGRHRGDRPEIHVWENGLRIERNTLLVTVGVHMESITVCETIDAIRATLERCNDRWKSIERTDHALGIAKPSRCYRDRLASIDCDR